MTDLDRPDFKAWIMDLAHRARHLQPEAKPEPTAGPPPDTYRDQQGRVFVRLQRPAVAFGFPEDVPDVAMPRNACRPLGYLTTGGMTLPRGSVVHISGPGSLAVAYRYARDLAAAKLGPVAYVSAASLPGEYHTAQTHRTEPVIVLGDVADIIGRARLHHVTEALLRARVDRRTCVIVGAHIPPLDRRSPEWGRLDEALDLYSGRRIVL